MLQIPLTFLTSLKENNNREWFAENRKQYEQARDEFASYATQLIPLINEFDSSLGPIEAKDCIFRIFRDVRFSLNKDPYKENMGAYIARGGRKRGFAGYYFHLEPGNSFISGGIYMAPTDVMRRIREDIDLYSAEFLSIVENPPFKKLFEGMGEEKLKRVPAGFSAESPVADYLKLKHITPFRSLSDKEVSDAKIINKTIETFRALSPLVAFLNRSIEGMQKG